MSEMTMRCVEMRDSKRHCHQRTNHDGMDGWMDSQSFTDDTVENGEFLHFFVCHGTKCSIRVGEMLQLFLEQSLAGNMAKIR